MTSESIHDVTDVIRSAARTLHDADIDTPEHDAKLLLAEACGRDLRDIDKAMLMGEPLDGLPREHASFDAPDAGAASSDSSATAGDAVTTALARFHAMIARRAAREPLQYITGHAPFRYLDLEVGPGVFIPRPETETVVQAGMVSPRQRVEPGAQVACALSHSGELGVGGIVEFAGEHFLALAGGYGRVSPPYRHMRPVVAGAGQRQVVAQWCNGKPCPGRPARRGGERTRGVGPCTGLPSVWQDVP